MIHRDCGIGSPCWKNDACSKNFPKPFQEATDMDADGFPAYRRRNDECQVRIGEVGNDRTRYYNNQWVVPYMGV